MGNAVIYRPAYDAEVEYLESTGTQYIDTGIVFNSPYTIELSFMLTKLNNYNSLIFGAWHDNDSTDRLQFYVTYINTFYNDGHSNITGVQLNAAPDTNTIYNITYTPTISQPDANSSMWLFARNNDSSTYLPYNGLRVYSCKIKDIDSDTVVRDFIPVRIGQVGYLYDKVSKQLFANKGTGNFILGNDVVNATIPQQRCVLYFGNQRSVGFERIYEEYEWLVGDGDATILHKDIDTLDIKILELDATGTYYAVGHYINSNHILKLYVGTSNIGGNYSGLIFFWETNIVSANYRTPSLNIDLGEHIITKTTETDQIGVFTDDVRHIKNATSDRDYVGTDLIFNQLIPNQSLYIGYLSSPNIHNLIPCKLLQSIPAILDGNGIARQAGECGMWDKVSNKFYGNVANSGTFTVKGPKCYEEYDTLLMDNGGATIPSGGSYFILSNDISLTNKVFTVNLGDTYRDLVIFGDTVDGSIYMINIYTYSNGNTTIQERHGNNNTISIKTYSSKIVILDFQNNVATVGTQQFNIQGTGYKFSNSTTTYWSGIKYLKNITVDNELNLIPCKLTHGIPASMDANGISRPAGTCGMWDKVNDKFYGNVANSGSFTVSND